MKTINNSLEIIVSTIFSTVVVKINKYIVYIIL